MAVCALAGWGLARGKGWQFYLLASGIHFLSNYTALLYYKGMVTLIQIEIIIAVIAVAVFGVVLWLRWRKNPGEPIEETVLTVEKPPSTPSSSSPSL